MGHLQAYAVSHDDTLHRALITLANGFLCETDTHTQTHTRMHIGARPHHRPHKAYGEGAHGLPGLGPCVRMGEHHRDLMNMSIHNHTNTCANTHANAMD